MSCRLYWWVQRVWKPYLFLQCKLLLIEWELYLFKLLRAITMPKTKKLVSIRQARHLVNVFWTAKMIVAAKQLACRVLSQNTPNALARFEKLVKTFKDENLIFLGKLPIWMPLRQLRLRSAREESGFGTLFRKFYQTIGSHTTRRWVFNPSFLSNFIQGGTNDNLEFKMDEDTEVFYSCSSLLNGELFVFGGISTSNNQRKQVNFKSVIR